jgi:hypothetical protein
MKKWFTCIILMIVFCVSQVSAQYEIPDDLCGSDGLVNEIESTILSEIQTIHEINPFVLIDFSPQCRYVIAVFKVATNLDKERLFVAWDVHTGGRLFEYVRPRSTNREVPVFHWNSELTQVLIGAWHNTGYLSFDRATHPYHLWKLDSSDAFVMRCEGVYDDCIVPIFQTVYWDNARNWLWTTGWNGVVAYDRNSGQSVRSFFNPPWDHGLFEPMSGHGFAFSDDGSHVIVYVTGGTVNSLTVWNIDQYIPFAINVDEFVPSSRRSSTGECSRRFDLSPDNRYLVVGFRALRIWDLQNLEPAYEDRLPIYRHEGPIARLGCLEFVDNTTIKTSTADGVQYWDLHTGELIQSD